MSAGWGWVDFSTRDRNRIAAIMSMLREQGVLDELGIGVIRDAISDQLFPGLSTIQTRAKYFLFTPVIVRRYLHESQDMTLPAFFDQTEGEYIEAAAKTYRKTRSETGVFGVTLGDARDLKNRPSSIYWNGQLTLGIIDLNGKNPGLAQYLRANSIKIKNHSKSEEDDPSAGLIDKTGVHMPANIVKSFNPANIFLTKEEASFLKNRLIERLSNHHPDSLLLHLLLDSELSAAIQLDESANFENTYMRYFGEEMQSLRSFGTARLAELMKLAFHFSHAMLGAHTLYNRLLQAKIGQPENWKDEWQEWLDHADQYTLPLDIDLLQEIAPAGKAMNFVMRWIAEIKKGDYAKLSELVVEQEFISKKGRARLKKPSLPPEQFESWIGMAAQNYRIRQAQTLVRDIENGLKNA